MKKVKILFNCSTNVIGGGVKNSCLFILKALESNEIEWIYAVSKEVAQLLKIKGIFLDHRFTTFEKSPARNRVARKLLIDLCGRVNPDLVYTMAGPAYVKFPVYHILGLSNAYLTHVDKFAYKLIENPLQRYKYKIYFKIQQFYSLRADHFIFQTDEARTSYCRRTKVNNKRTSVISNAFDSEMVQKLSHIEPNLIGEKVQIFCPGAFYRHKALQFIPAIAKELSKISNFSFEFVLTISESPLLNEIEAKSKKFGVSHLIRNHGPYNYYDAVSLYSRASLVFVPSLLETFSACYLEAMAAKKILIVADKDFARDVCGEAASYVDPLNPFETARLIESAISNPDDFVGKIENGKMVLKKYGDHQQRFQKISDLIVSKIQEKFTK